MAIPKTIILRSVNTPFQKEGAAASAITPGDILERTSTGTLQRRSTADVTGPKLVANINDLLGKEITDDYATSANVSAVYLSPGDEVYAFVAAAASAIIIGDDLSFDAAGGFAKAASGLVVATALEAVDNSGGGSKARLRVEMI